MRSSTYDIFSVYINVIVSWPDDDPRLGTKLVAI